MSQIFFQGIIKMRKTLKCEIFVQFWHLVTGIIIVSVDYILEVSFVRSAIHFVLYLCAVSFRMWAVMFLHNFLSLVSLNHVSSFTEPPSPLSWHPFMQVSFIIQVAHLHSLFFFCPRYALWQSNFSKASFLQEIFSDSKCSFCYQNCHFCFHT